MCSKSFCIKSYRLAVSVWVLFIISCVTLAYSQRSWLSFIVLGLFCFVFRWIFAKFCRDLKSDIDYAGTLNADGQSVRPIIIIFFFLLVNYHYRGWPSSVTRRPYVSIHWRTGEYSFKLFSIIYCEKKDSVIILYNLS